MTDEKHALSETVDATAERPRIYRFTRLQAFEIQGQTAKALVYVVMKIWPPFDPAAPIELKGVIDEETGQGTILLTPQPMYCELVAHEIRGCGITEPTTETIVSDETPDDPPAVPKHPGHAVMAPGKDRFDVAMGRKPDLKDVLKDGSALGGTLA